MGLALPLDAAGAENDNAFDWGNTRGGVLEISLMRCEQTLELPNHTYRRWALVGALVDGVRIQHRVTSGHHSGQYRFLFCTSRQAHPSLRSERHAVVVRDRIQVSKEKQVTQVLHATSLHSDESSV